MRWISQWWVRGISWIVGTVRLQIFHSFVQTPQQGRSAQSHQMSAKRDHGRFSSGLGQVDLTELNLDTDLVSPVHARAQILMRTRGSPGHARGWPALPSTWIMDLSYGSECSPELRHFGAPGPRVDVQMELKLAVSMDETSETVASIFVPRKDCDR